METLQRAWNIWKVNSQNITRSCGYHDSHLGHIGGRWLLSPLYHASWSQVVLQVFRERLSEKISTWQSQKVIGIWSVHCSWHCSCRTYFCCFFSALANICPYGLWCHSFKLLWWTVNSKPPSIPFGIVTCTFCDNLSQNTCIQQVELYRGSNVQSLFDTVYHYQWLLLIL